MLASAFFLASSIGNLWEFYLFIGGTIASWLAFALALMYLFRFARVADPQISPDGRSVLFTVTDVLKSENRTNSDVWIAPVNGGGTAARPFAAFSPD